MTRRHSAFGSFTILNDSPTTLHPDPPGLPHHATHTHTRRDPPVLTTPHTHHQKTCVASASSLSRAPAPLSCAAPPAPLARAGSARRTCSPRAARAVHRALRAIAPEAGVCSSALLSRANDRLISAEFGLDVHGRHKKFKEYYPKNTNNPCSNHRK